MQAGDGQQGGEKDEGNGQQKGVKAPRGKSAYFIFASEVRGKVQQENAGGSWGEFETGGNCCTAGLPCRGFHGGAGQDHWEDVECSDCR